MQLRLLVIRTASMPAVASFYERLGLVLEYHSHDGSPMHYSGKAGETIIEIYPLAKGQEQPDKNMRIGFSLADFDTVIENLKAAGVDFVSPPAQTPFGYCAIVHDPDGRKVELYREESGFL